MEIRRAKHCDLPALHRLLRQVLEVHHAGRPDLFRGGTEKYTDGELQDILCDETRPIFVAVQDGVACGYAFCIFRCFPADNILTDIKTLYIDDLCVDESARGQGIGRALYAYVHDFAKASGCYNLTLNVWACNESALRFYEACGLKPQKIGMETIL